MSPDLTISIDWYEKFFFSNIWEKFFTAYKRLPSFCISVPDPFSHQEARKLTGQYLQVRFSCSDELIMDCIVLLLHSKFCIPYFMMIFFTNF